MLTSVGDHSRKLISNDEEIDTDCSELTCAAPCWDNKTDGNVTQHSVTPAAPQGQDINKRHPAIQGQDINKRRPALQGQDIIKGHPAVQGQDRSVTMSIGLHQEPLPDLVLSSRPQARRRRHPATVQTPGSLTPDTAPDTLMEPLIPREKPRRSRLVELLGCCLKLKARAKFEETASKL